jgi:hypothetical protein
LDWLIFKEQLAFKKVDGLFRKFCSNDPADLNKLFDEVIDAKLIISQLEETTSFGQKSIEERWKVLFKNKDFVNLKKIVSIFLSIFPSNAFCESVFSVMNSIWTKERNRFLPDSINSFVFVKINSTLKCNSIFDYFLLQNDLLQAAKGYEKYQRNK